MKRYLLIAFLFLSATIAIAQPANDACSGAISTNPNGTCYTGTTVAATDGWLGTVGCAGNNPEVWYSFVATGSQLTYNVTSGTLGGNVELIVVSSTAACTGLTLVGSSCGASPLTGTMQGLQAGTTYYYTISGTGATGTFTTCMTTSNPAPVAGQDCPTASTLCTNASFTQSSSTAGFGTQEISPLNSCWGSGGERQSKWYKFTIGCSGTLGFIISPIVNTNDYDWALYNITSNPSACGLSAASAPVACNWSGCAGPTGLDASPTTVAGVQLCGGPAGACGGGSYPRAFCNETAANMNLVNVTAGQTYALLIDNFSTSNSGFNFSFSGTATIGPDAAFTLSSSNCGQNVTVTKTCATSNSTYLWNFGDGFTSTSAGPVSHTYATIGSYVVSLTVTDALGCSKTTSQTISGTPPSTPAPSSNSPVCAGSTLNLSTAAVAGATYSWTGPNSFTSTSQNPSITNVTTAASGTYSVVVTVGGCPSAAGTVSVTVNPVPTAPTAGSNSPLCAGSTLNLTSTAVAGATYSWTGPNSFTSSSQNPSITNATTAASGTYSVTVTVNGCTSAAGTVTVVVNPIPSAPTAGSNSPVCAGSALNLTATTVAGATYSWTGPNSFTSSSQNPSIANATTAANGTYSVTVTVNGCTSAAGTVTVVVNPVPTVTASAAASTLCSGQSTTITAAGATTYTWSPATGLSATTGSPVTATPTVTTTYTVTGTTSGCSSTATAAITVNPTPTIVSTPAAATVCSGNSTSLTASGASTYTWSPATGLNVTTGATVTASPTVTTTYTITGTTAAGCVNTTTVAVTVTAAPTITITPNAATICSGSSTSLTASGVTSYSWSPATGLSTTTGATVTASPGATTTYTVTGTASGCPNTSANVTVTVNPLPTVTASAGASSLCSGQSTTITSAGASSYTWSPATGLSATTGSSVTANPTVTTTYTITGTGANGCTNTTTLALTINSLPSATSSFTNVSCNSASNGTATVNATGGSGVYSYSWAPSGGTNASANNLAPGTYTVTVTDGNTCVTTSSVTITQPTALASSVTSQTNVLCNGGTTGSATVNITGGTPGYTYSWAPSGGTNASATGLGAGTYTLTATDANSCPKTQTVTITEPAALASSVASQTNVLCNGGTTGSATVNITGGTPGYTYAWTPSGGTAATATGLGTGTYTLSTTDANGCLQTQTVTITEPTALSSSTSSTNATCGNPDGTATVNASGGTPGYTYSWSPSGQTTATATNLTAGSYSVTVTDNNSCTQTVTISVNNASAPAATLSSSFNVSCNGGSDGSATVNVTGGTGTYAYAWSPAGGTAATATGLSAGSYTVSVTDGNNCLTTASVTITEPTVLAASLTVQTNVSCNGGTDGTAAVNVTGGTPNYTYSWSPSGGTAATATGLSMGTYTLSITDGNACVTTQTVSITEPAALSLVTAATNASCNTLNGTATVTPSGGSGTYTYLWNDAAAQTTATATGLAGGSYTVTVTDGNGCAQTASVTVTSNGAVNATLSASNNVTCNGSSDGSASVTASGGVGPYTYSWSPAGGTNASATGLAAGSYTVTITDNAGCTTTSSVTITQPAALSTAATTVNIGCNGGSTGSATSIPAGGTPPYFYAWTTSPVQTNASATGLAAGSYTVTVTDNNGCVTTSSITLTQPAALTAATVVNDATCAQPTGSAVVTPAGGTGPYTYLWTDPAGQTSANAFNLGGGSYTVTITDANGCTTTSSATISSVSPIVASFNSTPLTGPAPLVVTFTNNSPGAVTFLWNFGDNSTSTLANPTHTYSNGGTYSVTLVVTNADGCTDSIVFASIDVVAESALIIPNVFSPNGDGINDQFLPDAVNIVELHGEIFDRWGVLMQKWDAASQAWDGYTTSGKMATAGVYYYIITAKGADKKEYVLHGFVTLVR